MAVRIALVFALWVLAPRLGLADDAPPPLRRVDLPALLAMVENTPKQQMAEADVAAARAQLREITAMAGPKASVMAYLAPSPDVACLNPDCTRTDPANGEFGYSGLAAGVQLQIVQPLASFGKAGPAKRAAKAGIEARVALADASRADLMQDVARAYWGLKFAREVQFFLQDGLDELAAAKTRLQDRIAGGDADVTPLDERRVETLMAEASMQLADAVGAERTALAALRTLAGDAAIDIDEAPFVAADETLRPLADWLQTATAHRPELRAAKAGSRAMGELATLQARMLAPNLALVGGYRKSVARGMEDPPSFYANDPYNGQLTTVALVLQWTFEPLARAAKQKSAEAAHTRASKQAEAAAQLVAIEMSAAHAEAEAALARLAAARLGEKSSRAWLVGVVQADAVGAAETKEFADAYLASFMMRGRVAQAIFLWNVAQIKLARAAGTLGAETTR